MFGPNFGSMFCSWILIQDAAALSWGDADAVHALCKKHFGTTHVAWQGRAANVATGSLLGTVGCTSQTIIRWSQCQSIFRDVCQGFTFAILVCREMGYLNGVTLALLERKLALWRGCCKRCKGLVLADPGASVRVFHAFLHRLNVVGNPYVVCNRGNRLSWIETIKSSHHKNSV